MIESNSHSKSQGRPRSAPPTSIREKVEQGPEEVAPEATASKKVDLDPEKSVQTHGNTQEEIARSITLRTVPASPETTTNRISNDDSGREDEEYISGYKLVAALFGIISAFFIVLLDFSIISTVREFPCSPSLYSQGVSCYPQQADYLTLLNA